VHLILRLRGGGGGRRNVLKLPVPEMNLAPGGFIEQNIVQDPYRERATSDKPRRGWNDCSTAESPWGTSKTMTFNVQILNTTSYTRITGLQPPTTPVTAAEYAKRGLPFFSMDDAKTDVSGGLHDLKSVAQMDNVVEPVVRPRVRCSWRRSHRAKSNGQYAASSSSSLPTASTSVATPTGKDPEEELQKEPSPTDVGNTVMNSAAPPATAQNYTGQPLSHYTALKTALAADFFNPAGPWMPFRFVDDLERDLRQMTSVSFT